MKVNIRYLMILITLFVIVSFLATFLTSDFSYFIAYAKLVDNNAAKGIDAIESVWEIKGLFFRIIVYSWYIITRLFVNGWSETFQFVYKFQALIQWELILLLVVSILPSKYAKSRLNLWCCLNIILLSVHFTSHFQPEFVSVLFLLLATSVYLRGKLVERIVAGVIFSLVFYLKSPVALMGISFFSAIFLIEKEKTFKEVLIDFIPTGLSAALFLSISLILIKIYIPQEIDDILSASYMQHTLLQGSIRDILVGCAMLVLNIDIVFYIPTLILGIIASVILVLRNKECPVCILAHLSLWAAPILVVLIANCFFRYHYYPCLYSVVIALYLLSRDASDVVYKKWYVAVCSTLFVFYISFLSGFSWNVISQKIQYKKGIEELNKGGINFQTRLDENPVLYLDDSVGAFIFQNNSYIRYFYPQQVQRIDENSELVNLDFFKKTYNSILDYKGTYIVLYPKWFFKYSHDRIRNKLDKEYEVVKDFYYPSYNYNIFSTKMGYPHYQVLKRKDNI